MSKRLVAIIVTLAVLLMALVMVFRPASLQVEAKVQAASTAQAKLPNKLKQAKIVVFKSKRILQLFDGNQLLREYPIALGSNPIGHKYLEGDRATPEGDYYISHKNPKSQFYLSLGISYPNIKDAQYALNKKYISQAQYEQITTANQNKASPPQKTAMGGDIMIHGNGSAKDWTWGCIALNGGHIKELYSVITEKTPIRILP